MLTETDYLEVSLIGYGELWCENEHAYTEHTTNEYGEIFCVSCGHEPDPYGGEE